MAKQFKVLLPRSFHKLRISDELAGCFDTGKGEGAPEPTALVVSPFGKVWRVEVGRDDDGAFLGRGWAEFLAAHGVGLGWFVVLRHEGGGVLTVKVFDTSLCIKEFRAPAAVMTLKSSKGIICKPQFIRIFHPHLSEKMILPARFVKDYITEECLNSQTAIILTPLGKFWRIELKNDQSGIFFTGGWSQFLDFHGISNGDVLLLRYEGSMVFKFKAFGLSGCQKDFKNQNAEIQLNTQNQQEAPSPIRKHKGNDEKSSSEGNKRPKSSVTLANTKKQQATPSPIRKRKNNDEKPSSEGNKRPKSSVTLPNTKKQQETSSPIRKRKSNDEKSSSEGNKRPKSSVTHLSLKEPYQIGASSWIRKKINTYALERFLMTCTITLKTEMDSTRTWQVRGFACKNYRYILGEGWKSFCQDNRIKIGDLCTFNIIETTLWHVTITRSTLADTFKQKKSPCSSSRDHKTKKPKSVYDIGPPSWIRKEMNTYSIKTQLSLAQAFCNQIGLPQHCRITLKTSINSNNSWLVSGRKYNSYVIGLGWKRFCRENKVKVGDVCTFNVIKTTLWHVDIIRSTLADTFKQKKSPCSSNRDHKTDNRSSSSERTKKPKPSMTSLSKVPKCTRCVYNIGPPSWIQKEMNTNSIRKHLSLARAFCDRIGLPQHCTITLKTSINSSNSWRVGGLWQKKGSYLIGPGWKKFCRENKVEVGDVCTFNVIETKLWHVFVTHRHY